MSRFFSGLVQKIGQNNGRKSQNVNLAICLLVDCDDVALFRVRARQAQRQIVRLRARVDEKAHVQRSRHFGHDFLGALDDLVVQEAIVGRQDGHLLGGRLHHFRVAMADWIVLVRNNRWTKITNLHCRTNIVFAGAVDIFSYKMMIW